MVKDAIEAGIFHDLGSGSNVDVVVLTRDNPAEILRNYKRPNERGQKEQSYKFKRGTTCKQWCQAGKNVRVLYYHSNCTKLLIQ